MGSARRSRLKREPSLVILSDDDRDGISAGTPDHLGKRSGDGRTTRAKNTQSRPSSSSKRGRSRKASISSDSDSDEIVYVTSQRATQSNSAADIKKKDKRAEPSTSARVIEPSDGKDKASEEEVVKATPRKLLKGDGSGPTRPSQTEAEKTPGSSFKERLKANEKASPRFSQNFVGKAKSRGNHSIPLQDSRFESDPDAEERDSEVEAAERRPPVSRKSTGNASRQKTRVEESDIVVEGDKATSTYETDNSLPSLNGLATKPRSDPKRLKRRVQLGDQESDESEVTFLKSSQGRQEALSQYTNQRKEKEKRNKHKHRVIASPSPAPDASSKRQKPIFQSDPNTPTAPKRKQVNVRGITSSVSAKKRRRRKVMSPDDSSDTDDEDGIATDEAPPDPSEFRRQQNEKGNARRRSGHSSSQVKSQKRHRHDSESSSSSDSSRSFSSDVRSSEEPAKDEDDLAGEITLDYDPRKEEKLRPKNTKVSDRFAKYRQAQEKKIKKEIQRKRNVVESDDEGGATKVKEDSSDGSIDDDEKELDLDADEQDFIVEDDDMDEYDRNRQAIIEDSLLPVEFSSHGKMKLEGHFKAFVKYIVLLYFFPGAKRLRNNEKYQYSIRALRSATEGLVNGAVASSIWQERFRKTVDTRPDLEMERIDYGPGCDGCNRYDRTASWRAHLSGQRYDPETFEAEDGEEPDEQTFDIGRFCADKASTVHRLSHILYQTANTIRSECEKLDSISGRLARDSDGRRRQRDKEADRITKVLAKEKKRNALFPVTTELWHNFRDKIKEAQRQFLQQS